MAQKLSQKIKDLIDNGLDFETERLCSGSVKKLDGRCKRILHTRLPIVRFFDAIWVVRGMPH
jgi:hypothetical protein